MSHDLCRQEAAMLARQARIAGGAVLAVAASVFLLQGCGSVNPTPSETQARALGASAAQIQVDALADAVEKGMKAASIPGSIIGIWREDEPAFVRAFGMQDAGRGAPMSTKVAMRIGSNTKAFVVTSIMILADRGKLHLDDPVSRHIEGVPDGEKITLRQLAQMRSGLYDYSEDTNKDQAKQPMRQWTPPELLALSFAHPLLFPPGSAFDYSNTNTVLLGLVVEKVSGQSLGSFIEENILKPEGMSHTVFPKGAELPSPHSRGYQKVDGKLVDATDWDPSWGWAAGNMVSTLEDMRVWTRDYAEGKLISPEMKKQQQEFFPAPQEGDGTLYGLGLENQNGWLGHNGNIMSYMVYPYYLPEEKLTMVVMLNSGADVPGSWKMMQDITKIVSPKHVWPGLPKQ